MHFSHQPQPNYYRNDMHYINILANHFPDTHHPCDYVLGILSVMWSNLWSNQSSHLALESQFRDYEIFYVNYIRQTNFITQLLIIFHKSTHKMN